MAVGAASTANQATYRTRCGPTPALHRLCCTWQPVLPSSRWQHSPPTPPARQPSRSHLVAGCHRPSLRSSRGWGAGCDGGLCGGRGRAVGRPGHGVVGSPGRRIEGHGFGKLEFVRIHGLGVAARLAGRQHLQEVGGDQEGKQWEWGRAWRACALTSTAPRHTFRVTRVQPHSTHTHTHTHTRTHTQTHTNTHERQPCTCLLLAHPAVVRAAQ